jgi:hypothetical protein
MDMRKMLACLIASTSLLACEFSNTRHPGETVPATEPAPRRTPPYSGFPKGPKATTDESSTPSSVAATLTSTPEPSLDWKRLTGHWYATNKHQKDGSRTFVREDPGPARFRAHYHFERSGKVQFRMLASNDGHYTLEGTWTRKGKRIVIEATREGEPFVRLIDVLSLSDDSMRIRLVPFQG